MDSQRIWSQSIARQSLVGGSTHNPSAAASAVLRRAFGRKRVTRAVRRVVRRRRSFFRGNPLPAALGVLGGLGGLGKRFRAPSEKRAAAIATAIVTSANTGNLTAARGLIERAVHPMKAKEAAVWRLAAAQLAPKMRAAVTRFAELIPAADQSSPEAFATSVMATPVSLTDIEAQAREARAVMGAAATRRLAAAEAKQARREELLAGVGGQVGAALLGRGRGLRRPARRRRSRGRAFSF